MIRVAIISPEPTPYRAPLFDRLAARPELDLTVLYAAKTVAARSWSVPLSHDAIFIGGRPLPLSRVLHHEYLVSTRVTKLLNRGRYDCVVIAGWSVFASQVAILWARAHRIPYVLMFESHLLEPRPRLIRTLKNTVIPRVIRPAAGCLVTGTLAREAAISFGADARRVRTFANTIDVDATATRIAEARSNRSEIRRRCGVQSSDVLVLSVGRLAPEKGMKTVAAAAQAAGMHALIVGDGPERACIERAGATIAGFLEGPDLDAAYAAADVFMLASHREPWGVVVNEAAAAALPLVLSTQVGAAPDLLRVGENGFLVRPGDLAGAVEALRSLEEPRVRRQFGARSREIASAWGYEPSVQAFIEAVEEAVCDP